MLALSSLPALSIDTFTSNVVTLSFSTPIGEICVTRPSKTRVGKALGGDLRGLAEPHAADVGFVHLAAHEHLLDVAERHDQRGVGAEVEDRRHRAADLDVARQHGGADRRLDRGVGQLLFGSARRRRAPARRWRWPRPPWRARSRADRRRRACGSRPARARSSRRRAPTATPASARRAARRAVWLRRANATSGASASISFFFSCATAPSRAASAACRLARASRRRAVRFSLSSSASTRPASTT